MRRDIQFKDGIALLYDWVPGKVLDESSRFPGAPGRNRPDRPHKRYPSLPTLEIVAALSVIYEVYRDLAAHDFIAVDFYERSIIYDFDRATIYLCALSNPHKLFNNKWTASKGLGTDFC